MATVGNAMVSMVTGRLRSENKKKYSNWYLEFIQCFKYLLSVDHSC